MYKYKLMSDTRLWHVYDRDMNIDPYDFFKIRDVEHWTHINVVDGSIDLDTICSKCNYWYGMTEGEHVSQCPKCGNIEYYD